ncbi:hypothetical protein AB0E55_04670 [Amycolatopsis keratiniphila]|uniref:hypothetical protein n=1 Tax=Amycolatopsis keratiniphila TaxID=129921 RepID=UPI0033EDC431
MPVPPHVTITPGELPALRAAMRDAQTAAADYYGKTARTATVEDLGTPVRTFLSASQTVNDLLTHVVSDSATYGHIMNSGAHPGAAVIRGVKYVRNVAQHLAHVIHPRDDYVLIGSMHNLRIYTFWDDVPDTVHAQLRPGTQRLRADYEALLLGKNVTDTLLDTLAFFSGIAPDIPHRDQRGEWTGFPLMSQPNVRDRLHPEEPSDETTARQWLDQRQPNGDLRVISGQLTIGETRYVFGHTFERRITYTPFVETADQVRRDIAAGYRYVAGDVLANTVDRTHDISPAVHGAVFESLADIAAWTIPVPSGGWDEDWVDEKSVHIWRRLIELEHGDCLPASLSYLIRRERRLYAGVPYSP